MKHLIHDAPGYRLEVAITHTSAGPTVEFISTWPMANHPEPHRLLTLTLPPDAFVKLADVLRQECQP
mgnify:CR=1 FL=1|jgi:hypothetical protein